MPVHVAASGGEWGNDEILIHIQRRRNLLHTPAPPRAQHDQPPDVTTIGETPFRLFPRVPVASLLIVGCSQGILDVLAGDRWCE